MNKLFKILWLPRTIFRLKRYMAIYWWNFKFLYPLTGTLLSKSHFKQLFACVLLRTYFLKFIIYVRNAWNEYFSFLCYLFLTLTVILNSYFQVTFSKYILTYIQNIYIYIYIYIYILSYVRWYNNIIYKSLFLYFFGYHRNKIYLMRLFFLTNRACFMPKVESELMQSTI